MPKMSNAEILKLIIRKQKRTIILAKEVVKNSSSIKSIEMPAKCVVYSAEETVRRADMALAFLEGRW